ncbi:unnamed protein product, partial [Ixodes pacificus]
MRSPWWNAERRSQQPILPRRARDPGGLPADAAHGSALRTHQLLSRHQPRVEVCHIVPGRSALLCASHHHGRRDY